MDLKKEITEMIYKNSHDTSEGVLIDFKVITPLIENIVAIAVTHCCKSDSELLKVFIGKEKDIDLISGNKCRLLKYTEESFLVQYNHNEQIEWVGVSDLKTENL